MNVLLLSHIIIFVFCHDLCHVFQFIQEDKFNDIAFAVLLFKQFERILHFDLISL